MKWSFDMSWAWNPQFGNLWYLYPKLSFYGNIKHIFAIVEDNWEEAIARTLQINIDLDNRHRNRFISPNENKMLCVSLVTFPSIV